MHIWMSFVLHLNFLLSPVLLTERPQHSTSKPGLPAHGPLTFHSPQGTAMREKCCTNI